MRGSGGETGTHAASGLGPGTCSREEGPNHTPFSAGLLKFSLESSLISSAMFCLFSIVQLSLKNRHKS